MKTNKITFFILILMCGYLSPLLGSDVTREITITFGETLNDIPYGQRNVDVAIDAQGGYFLVWDDKGIWARRYDPNGTPSGEAFMVSESSGNFDYPQITLNPETGKYLLTWLAHSSTNDSGWPAYTLWGRQYGGDDVVLGNAFQISEKDEWIQGAKTIVNTNGQMVVVWWVRTANPSSGHDDKILIRAYDDQGTPLTQATPVLEGLFGDIANYPQGGWVITYSIQHEGGDKEGYCQRFDINTDPIGEALAFFYVPYKEKPISTHTIPYIHYATPQITMDSQGDFVAAWAVQNNKIRVKGFDRDGIATGDGVRLDSSVISSDFQCMQPCIAMDGQGNVMIVWKSYDKVYAQGFNTDLEVQGESAVVKEDSSYLRTDPVFSMNKSGEFVVVSGSLLDLSHAYYLTRGSFTISDSSSGSESACFPSTTIGFNPYYYLYNNPDLEALGYTLDTIKDHWDRYGIYEGRKASRYFNAKYYLENYNDLKDAFGSDFKAAYDHFLNYGVYEGRQGSKDFDVTSYTERYPDLQAAFGNNYEAAFLHWIRYGACEGRQGTGDEGQGHVAGWND